MPFRWPLLHSIISEFRLSARAHRYRLPWSTGRQNAVSVEVYKGDGDLWEEGDVFMCYFISHILRVVFFLFFFFFFFFRT